MKSIKNTVKSLEKVGNWISAGDTGLSSEALLAVYLGATKVKNYNHPLDPSDFNRCVLFLECIGWSEVRPLLHQMSKLSAEWSAISTHWDELWTLWRTERKDKSAPKLYAKMKEIGL